MIDLINAPKAKRQSDQQQAFITNPHSLNKIQRCDYVNLGIEHRK